MNLKILTAAMLLLSAPALASGVCIVCPPGYDCSTGTPTLDGTTGQVLARGTSGIEWKDMSWVNITDKPTIPSASSTTPKALGTALVGSETSFARGDHVHPTTGLVPTTRKIFGKAITADFTVGDLIDAKNTCNSLSQSGHTIEPRCSTTGGTYNVVGNPGTASTGRYCWCRFSSSAPSCGSSAWVYLKDEGPASESDCAAYCGSWCTNATPWRASSVW